MKKKTEAFMRKNRKKMEKMAERKVDRIHEKRMKEKIVGS